MRITKTRDTKSRILSQTRRLTLQALTLQTYGFAPLTRWRRDLRKGLWGKLQKLPEKSPISGKKKGKLLLEIELKEKKLKGSQNLLR